MRQGLELTPELRDSLERDGYSELRVIPGRGICGVIRMIFTTGLCHGLDEYSREGRWCYPTMSEAVIALNEWNGEGDPSGEWIKYKGRTEYSRIPNESDDE